MAKEKMSQIVFTEKKILCKEGDDIEKHNYEHTI